MDLRDGAVTMSLDGTSSGRPIEGVDPRVVLYLGLFPNLLISLHPDYVMAHRLTPVGPARTSVECSWYFLDDDTDPTYAVEFWDLTNRQDWSACESVQRDCRHRTSDRTVRAERGRSPPVGDHGGSGIPGHRPAHDGVEHSVL